MEFDQFGVSLVCNKAVSVHTKPVNVAERSRDTVTGHGPEESVEGAGLLAEEVPGRVVGSGCLWDLVVTPRLDCVDQIGELDGILDEKDGNVVANDVCK